MSNNKQIGLQVAELIKQMDPEEDGVIFIACYDAPDGNGQAQICGCGKLGNISDGLYAALHRPGIMNAMVNALTRYSRDGGYYLQKTDINGKPLTEDAENILKNLFDGKL